jgi:hypothetical protein
MNKSTARFESGVARYSLLAYLFGMSSFAAFRAPSHQTKSLATMFGGEDPYGFALEPLATIYKGFICRLFLVAI